MNNYLLKCLYKIQKPNGATKVKKESVNLKLDATTEQIRASRQLHISLGKAFQKQNKNKVIAIEIKDIITLDN